MAFLIVYHSVPMAHAYTHLISIKEFHRNCLGQVNGTMKKILEGHRLLSQDVLLNTF